jgi:hypothetical protein
MCVNMLSWDLSHFEYINMESIVPGAWFQQVVPKTNLTVEHMISASVALSPFS